MYYFGNLCLNLTHYAVEHGGDKPFLTMPGRKPLMFSELRLAVWRMHTRLMLLGVLPGDRVIVQADKSIEAVVLYLACLHAGAVFVPLNTAYTPRELEYFIKDATPRLVVCRPPDERKVRRLIKDYDKARGAFKDAGYEERHKKPTQCRSLGVAGDGSFFEKLYCDHSLPYMVERPADAVAAILYTSGTTGRPKGAMLTHANLLSNAAALREYWQWDDHNDVLLHALPIFHVHGLFVALHCAMLGGSPVWFLPKFDADEVMKYLPQSTVMMGVPTFYTRLLEREDFNAEACRDMRLFISGSAPLAAETHRAFEQRTGHRILERYGMTEAGMITSNPYDGERIAGTVGYALPGIETRIADDNNNAVAAGKVGVLQTRGPNVFKGYWNAAEKTTEEFTADGWFITGDMATQDKDGRVSIVGRAKDLIISGGYNVYPKEVEMAIDESPQVKESAVIGVPHADFGEAVVAVVVAQGDIAEDDVLRPLQDKLARFKQPKKIFFIESLPRNAMGKVQKAQLREAYKNTFAD